MKTTEDPRHKKRLKTIKELFSWAFYQTKGREHLVKLSFPAAKEVIIHQKDIDEEITEAAAEWPLEQINKIDLAILRLAIFELIIKKDQPFKVIVDEAVEIAKELGTQSSPGFINGVLGKVISKYKLDK